MDSRSILKFLVPQGTWLWRTIILLGFIFLDFLVTVLLCTNPYAEGNLLARSFMQIYGIVQGLAIFDLLMTIPIYFILVFDSYLIRYTGPYSTFAELFVDVALGWVVAGAHFNGALSWLWEAPHLTRQMIGLGLYLSIVFPAFYFRSKLDFPRFIRE
ncbi:hypothetical protein KEJ18_06080 [Candidatus Bathyarchaeota archaeon]|nr:hypothetical protein [Candidatus Bathyarchaeota archaeon]